jgi:dimethylhistidine N-methyltransferase
LRIVQERTESGSVTLYDFEPPPDRICEDVVRGLSAIPKKLQPKYFYDARGAQLFDRITDLEAYYPTQTEISILRRHADEMTARIGPHARLVEFGSGSGDKTWIILRHLTDPTAYIPIDISRAQLVSFALKVAEAFPALRVIPVCADYTAELALPEIQDGGGRCVAFFPGSTIGNFEPSEAEAFLRRVRRLVGNSGGLLLGVDLIKDPAIIERAYNDPQGVTAEFNLNLLTRINRECGADFDVGAFTHYAFFDQAHHRVEMRLVSTRDQIVHVCADPDTGPPTAVHFAAGEHITTEYSHKYDLEDLRELADGAGWSITQLWTDPQNWFAVALLS